MKITERTPEDLYEGHMSIKIDTENGSKEISFGAGEPEDMSLARDLNDALRIKSMLILAYEAGKRGEDIEIEELEEEED